MHAVVGAGLADDLLGFTEILTKPAPTAICHNFHLIWYHYSEFKGTRLNVDKDGL